MQKNNVTMKHGLLKYFGGAVKVSDQLTYITSMTDDDKAVQHESYALLYVYIKALYQFYKHAVGKNVTKRIVELGKEVGQTLNYSVKGGTLGNSFLSI